MPVTQPVCVTQRYCCAWRQAGARLSQQPSHRSELLRINWSSSACGHIERRSAILTGAIRVSTVAQKPTDQLGVAHRRSYVQRRPTLAVAGVNADLVVRPFHQKGVVVSLREFTNNAYNHHHGIQSVERFGRTTKTLPPGLHFIMPVVDRIRATPNIEVKTRVELAAVCGTRHLERVALEACKIADAREPRLQQPSLGLRTDAPQPPDRKRLQERAFRAGLLAPVYTCAHHAHPTLLAADEMVDRIMAHLEVGGDLGRTLVVFTSDNGFAWGERGMTSKGLPYTEHVKVPVLARWDGVFPAGGADRRPVSGEDFLPTFLQAAGYQPPAPRHPLDGRSFLPGEPGREVRG